MKSGPALAAISPAILVSGHATNRAGTTTRSAGILLLLVGSLVAYSPRLRATSVAPATTATPDASAPQGASAPYGGLLSLGFLSTSGNQIVDSKGIPQRLACAGYNEPSHDIPGDLAGMKKAGFNCARFPFDGRHRRRRCATWHEGDF